MIKILKNKYIYLFLLIFIFLVFKNINILRENDRMLSYVNDEYHTIGLTSQKVFTKVSDSRVLGGARWILRLTYIPSIYYLNTRMAGEHSITGWDYPGHNYIVKNSNFENIKNDPSLQDYIYFQRMAINTLYAFSLAFICCILWQRVSLVASLTYLTILSTYYGINQQLTYAYVDIPLVSFVNLMYGIILIGNLNKLWLNILVILCAVTISTKLYGFLVCLPVIVLMSYSSDYFRANIKRYLLFFIFLLLIFNLYELLKPDNFLHYTMANIYHYKTGHYATSPSGLYQFKLGIEKIGYIFYLFLFTLPILIFNYRNKYLFIFLSSILFSLLIFLFAISNVNIFMERNWIIPAVLMAFILSVNIGSFVYSVNKFFTKKYFSYAISLLCIGYLTYITSYQINKFYTINPVDLYYEDSLKNCNKVGIIGSVNDNKRGYSRIPSIPESYHLGNDLLKFENNLTSYDCILAKFDGYNKQYTHYILPKKYILNKRFGDVFLYKTK
jgi:hypothetical protein